MGGSVVTNDKQKRTQNAIKLTLSVKDAEILSKNLSKVRLNKTLSDFISKFTSLLNKNILESQNKGSNYFRFGIRPGSLLLLSSVFLKLGLISKDEYNYIHSGVDSGSLSGKDVENLLKSAVTSINRNIIPKPSKAGPKVKNEKRAGQPKDKKGRNHPKAGSKGKSSSISTGVRAASILSESRTEGAREFSKGLKEHHKASIERKVDRAIDRLREILSLRPEDADNKPYFFYVDYLYNYLSPLLTDLELINRLPKDKRIVYYKRFLKVFGVKASILTSSRLKGQTSLYLEKLRTFRDSIKLLLPYFNGTAKMYIDGKVTDDFKSQVKFYLDSAKDLGMDLKIAKKRLSTLIGGSDLKGSHIDVSESKNGSYRIKYDGSEIDPTLRSSASEYFKIYTSDQVSYSSESSVGEPTQFRSNLATMVRDRFGSGTYEYYKFLSLMKKHNVPPSAAGIILSHIRSNSLLLKTYALDVIERYGESLGGLLDRESGEPQAKLLEFLDRLSNATSHGAKHLGEIHEKILLEITRLGSPEAGRFLEQLSLGGRSALVGIPATPPLSAIMNSNLGMQYVMLGGSASGYKVIQFNRLLGLNVPSFTGSVASPYSIIMGLFGPALRKYNSNLSTSLVGSPPLTAILYSNSTLPPIGPLDSWSLSGVVSGGTNIPTSHSYQGSVTGGGQSGFLSYRGSDDKKLQNLRGTAHNLDLKNRLFRRVINGDFNIDNTSDRLMLKAYLDMYVIGDVRVVTVARTTDNGVDFLIYENKNGNWALYRRQHYSKDYLEHEFKGASWKGLGGGLIIIEDTSSGDTKYHPGLSAHISFDKFSVALKAISMETSQGEKFTNGAVVIKGGDKNSGFLAFVTANPIEITVDPSKIPPPTDLIRQAMINSAFVPEGITGVSFEKGAVVGFKVWIVERDQNNRVKKRIYGNIYMSSYEGKYHLYVPKGQGSSTDSSSGRRDTVYADFVWEDKENGWKFVGVSKINRNQLEGVKEIPGTEESVVGFHLKGPKLVATGFASKSRGNLYFSYGNLKKEGLAVSGRGFYENEGEDRGILAEFTYGLLSEGPTQDSNKILRMGGIAGYSLESGVSSNLFGGIGGLFTKDWSIRAMGSYLSSTTEPKISTSSQSSLTLTNQSLVGTATQSPVGLKIPDKGLLIGKVSYEYKPDKTKSKENKEEDVKDGETKEGESEMDQIKEHKSDEDLSGSLTLGGVSSVDGDILSFNMGLQLNFDRSVLGLAGGYVNRRLSTLDSRASFYYATLYGNYVFGGGYLTGSSGLFYDKAGNVYGVGLVSWNRASRGWITSGTTYLMHSKDSGQFRLSTNIYQEETWRLDLNVDANWSQTGNSYSIMFMFNKRF